VTESFEQQTFKRGSTTYYWSSKFFPKNTRDDVYKLYSFVRTADDYVDTVPPKPEDFFALKTAWKTGDVTQLSKVNARVLTNMAQLTRRYDFDKSWVDAFLAEMETDLLPTPHATLTDSLNYVYGSAEVIGLMMARIMQLPAEAEQAARLQGRAMQWINFIRDINEDNDLGRSYFPLTDLKKFGLKSLDKKEVSKKPDAFKKFAQFQIKRYEQWQRDAQKAYAFIPRRTRVPLQTAADMYDWTARKIAKDPLIVFERKVKPSKWRVLCTAVWNQIRG
jgi:phytoene synthase